MAWRLGNGKLRKDQTDHYGRVKNGGGGGGASLSDFEDSTDIKFVESNAGKIKALLTDVIKGILNTAVTTEDLADSDEIVVDVEDDSIKFNLAQTVSNKIANSLQTPLQKPTEIELVAIDTSKSQQRITLDSNTLEILNNVLKVKSGGGGLSFDDIYPVGSVYSTVDSEVDPSDLFGGTWTLIANSIVTSLTENVFGNGKTLGITDGTTFGGSAISSEGNLGAFSSAYGVNIGIGNPSAREFNNVTAGIATKTLLDDDLENSGLIVERNQETVYIWKRTA